MYWEKRLLRNVHQYIFPTLSNTLHSKNSKYTVFDIDYRRDVHESLKRDKKRENERKKCQIMKEN